MAKQNGQFDAAIGLFQHILQNDEIGPVCLNLKRHSRSFACMAILGCLMYFMSSFWFFSSTFYFDIDFFAHLARCALWWSVHNHAHTHTKITDHTQINGTWTISVEILLLQEFSRSVPRTRITSYGVGNVFTGKKENNESHNNNDITHFMVRDPWVIIRTM